MPHQMSGPVSPQMPPPDTGHQVAGQNPHTEVLQRYQLEGIDAHIMRAHVVCVDDNRLPKALLYRQLNSGQRPASRPMKWLKDVLKSNLKWCSINWTTWEMTAQARSSWRRTCFAGISEFENNRITALLENRARCKDNQFINNTETNTDHVCHICGRQCAAAIGLVPHL